MEIIDFTIDARHFELVEKSRVLMLNSIFRQHARFLDKFEMTG